MRSGGEVLGVGRARRLEEQVPCGHDAAADDDDLRVDVLPQRDDAPDMVYAMNLGLALPGVAGDRVVLVPRRVRLTP